MSWERRNNDFCTAQTNAQMAYIEAEREVVRLESKNAKLREQGARLFDKTLELATENAKLRELASILCYCMQVHADCDGCRLNGAKGEIVADPLLACYGLHELLRELGVDE